MAVAIDRNHNGENPAWGGGALWWGEARESQS